MFLEDGNWNEANTYCEKVLDIDPECAEAYLGKLMAELKVRSCKQLADCAKPFDGKDNYSKVLRFGDEKIEAELRGYIKHINDRNENARLTGIYNNAVNTMNAANSEESYAKAAHIFQSIRGFKDADALAEKCLDKAEVCRKDAVYSSAKSKMTGEKVAPYEEAIKIFQTISGWKDADEQIYACQKKIEEIKAKEEADRLEAERKAEERRIAAEKAAKKRKKIIAITTPIVCACIAFIIVLTTVIIPKQKLNNAMSLLDSGDYDSAYALLEGIGNNEAIASSKYDRAMALIDSGDYDSAYALLEEIGNNEAIASSKYDRAMALIDSGDYDSAYALLEEIGNSEAIASSKYDRAMALIDSGDYDSAYALLEEIGNSEAIASSKYDRAMALIDSGDYDSAYAFLEALGDNETIASSKYDRAMALLDSGDYEPAYMLLNHLDYKDSDDKLQSIKPEYQKILLSKANVGDTVIFGSYEQDNDTSNGKEDIEWRVLAKEGDKLLVISNKALDCQQYNTSDTVEAWETCSLRKWINDTFLNAAFSAEEQAQIQKYSTNPGNATTDKVFLLSITEVKKYFSSDEDRKCVPTEYAIAQGAYTSSSETKGGAATCSWWLRAYGDTWGPAALVYSSGSLAYCFGDAVHSDNDCVRPALWINLD